MNFEDTTEYKESVLAKINGTKDDYIYVAMPITGVVYATVHSRPGIVDLCIEVNDQSRMASIASDVRDEIEKVRPCGVMVNVWVKM